MSSLIADIINDTVHTKWKDVLLDEGNLVRYKFISEKLKSLPSYLPREDQIFKSFMHFDPMDCKVVILGQDPYHNTYKVPKTNGKVTIPYSCGLSFSYSEGIPKARYSLKNIFKELNMEYGGSMRTNCDLSSWAKQGVLMLNTVLTVNQGKANSHKDYGWQDITDNVIQYLSKHNKKVIYLLMGKQAQEKVNLISSDNQIVSVGHPSPMNRKGTFIGSNCFRMVNEKIIGNGSNMIIDWLA